MEKVVVEIMPDFERETKDDERRIRLIVVRFSETKGKGERPRNGGVAQLGEHLPCKQGVKGSNPFISTTVRTERTDGKAGAKRNGLIAQKVRAHA